MSSPLLEEASVSTEGEGDEECVSTEEEEEDHDQLTTWLHEKVVQVSKIQGREKVDETWLKGKLTASNPES